MADQSLAATLLAMTTEASADSNATIKQTQTVQLNQHGYFVSLSVNLALIVVGNLAMLGHVAGRPKSRMIHFLTNMAVADLSVGLFAVLPQIVDRILMQFHGPEILCKSKWLLQTLVAYAAPYALVALSIDRVDAIVKPLRASTSKRGLQTGCIIAGAWLISFIASCPNLLWTSVTRHRRFGRQCSLSYGAAGNVSRQEKEQFWRIHVTTNLITIIVLPVTIVAICHIVLVVKIFQSSRGPKLAAHGRGRSSNRDLLRTGGGDETHCRVSNRNAVSRAKVKTVKVTCTIVSVFILCWLPFTVGNFLDVFKVVSVSLHTKVVIQTLGTLNSAANPIIFFIFNYNQCCRRADRNGTAWFQATTTRTRHNTNYNGTCSVTTGEQRRRSSSQASRNRLLHVHQLHRLIISQETIPLTSCGSACNSRRVSDAPVEMVELMMSGEV